MAGGLWSATVAMRTIPKKTSQIDAAMNSPSLAPVSRFIGRYPPNMQRDLVARRAVKLDAPLLRLNGA
jgi:hypothetical protein